MKYSHFHIVEAHVSTKACVTPSSIAQIQTTSQMMTLEEALS